MIKFYRFPISGHSHRVELMLNLLGVAYEGIDIDLAGGEHKKETFLKLNPFGVIPVIDDNGFVLADSNAIILYLAKKYGDTSWLPEDAETAANIQRWLTVSSSELARGPAAARLVNVFGAAIDHADALKRAEAVLTVMDAHLGKQAFLAADTITIADISAYSYVAHAPEGDVPLTLYPNIQAWLARVETQDGFVPMPKTAVGLAA